MEHAQYGTHTCSQHTPESRNLKPIKVLSPDWLVELYPYQFENFDFSNVDRRVWAMSFFYQLVRDIDEVLGHDKRGFHWVHLKQKFKDFSLQAKMDGQLLVRFSEQGIDRSQRHYLPADKTLEQVRLLMRIAEHNANHDGILRLFLGDHFLIPPGWLRAYWPTEVIALFETGEVRELSLGNDLGTINDASGTGDEVLDWIENAVAGGVFRPPKMVVHAFDEPVRQRMLARIHAIEQLIEDRRIKQETQGIRACFHVETNSLGIEYGVMPLTQEVVTRLLNCAKLCEEHKLIGVEVADIPVHWVRQGELFAPQFTCVTVAENVCSFSASIDLLPTGEFIPECHHQGDGQFEAVARQRGKQDSSLEIWASWFSPAHSFEMDEIRGCANFEGEVWCAFKDMDGAVED